MKAAGLDEVVARLGGAPRLLAFIALGALGACEPGGPSEESSRPAGDVLQKAAPVQATLAAIRQRFPDPTSLVSRACGPEVGPIGTIDLSWNNLLRITGGDQALRADSLTSDSGFDSFEFRRFPSVGSTAASISPALGADVLRAIERFGRSQHVVIARPTLVQRPRLLGSTFDSGRIEAWLVWFRTDDRSTACARKVTVTSGDSVSALVDRSPFVRDDPSRTLAFELERDLKSRFESALSDAARAR